ncbi:phenylalanine--tRNA ligase, chloroplastic/mitochondrial, partial [Haematococcus lacustris]
MVALVLCVQMWMAAGQDSTQFVAAELKQVLEGLARHLFGDVECRWQMAGGAGVRGDAANHPGQ